MSYGSNHNMTQKMLDPIRLEADVLENQMRDTDPDRIREELASRIALRVVQLLVALGALALVLWAFFF